MGRIKTRILSLEDRVKKSNKNRGSMARRFLLSLHRVYGDVDGEEPTAADLDAAALTLEADIQAALDRVYGTDDGSG